MVMATKKQLQEMIEKLQEENKEYKENLDKLVEKKIKKETTLLRVKISMLENSNKELTETLNILNKYTHNTPLLHQNKHYIKIIDSLESKLEYYKNMIKSTTESNQRESIELINENNKLKEKVDELTKQLNNRPKLGRKAKITEEDKTLIQMYRIQGKTIRELAKDFNCSIGTIQGIVKEI